MTPPLYTVTRCDSDDSRDTVTDLRDVTDRRAVIRQTVTDRFIVNGQSVTDGFTGT